MRGRKRRGGAISHSPVRSSISPSSPESTHSEEAEMTEQNNRNVSDYATPKLDGCNIFGGSPIEDPNNHILNFLEICDTFKHNGVSDDAIRLRLFPFSLRDKTKVWLQSLPEGSISTWEELHNNFLLKTMSSNNHQRHSDRNVHARVAGVQDSNMFASLSSQIAALTKEVKSLGIQGAVKAMVDRSIAYPRGIIENVLVKVDKLILPADFIVLDYEEDKNVPIILDRPFLATRRAIIDVQKGELTMRVQDQEDDELKYHPIDPSEVFKYPYAETCDVDFLGVQRY
ncbi:hypothetical protein G2W53_026770 [Senna tora]|uniref:Retrotransposon gag domain-containing protein n=1 Tax=Senna tora TaxID=362788 RepID=A0A834WFD8_9FABA|nr:hypothetical protein G2W53_026770 [Senna tora]